VVHTEMYGVFTVNTNYKQREFTLARNIS